MWRSCDDILMARYSAFNPFRLRNNAMGFPTPIGAEDAMFKSLYCCMKPISCWSSESAGTPTGGIFNLEFSPEGSLLVAACEKRTIQIFDPITHKRIHCMVGAHLDCINCVKFLDARMFATCSDDTTIALWDVRNLTKKIRSLVGHSKWVKNIEFSQKDKLLVTSGLDGSIYTWDINCYTESNLVHQRVFHTSSLMRCRLTPNAKQMILCTTGGLIVVIHDLNLATLGHDLQGFKPNLYRLMQMSQQRIPIASKYDYLFDLDRKSNRIEFISDFPPGNDAEVVSSLQIHPQGWTALSRNISHDDRSEWTCVHDIQPYDPRVQKGTRDRSPSPLRGPLPRRAPRRMSRRTRIMLASSPTSGILPPSAGQGASRIVRRSVRIERARADHPPPPEDDDDYYEPEELTRPRRSMRLQAGAARPDSPRERPQANRAEGAGEENAREQREVAGNPREGAPELPGPSNRPLSPASAAAATADAAVSRFGRGIQNDLWEASITIKQHRILQEIFRRGSVRRSFNMQRITGINTGITPPSAPSDTPISRPSLSGMTPESLGVEDQGGAEVKQGIKQNKERLLFYVEETNEGKGFIKELCYSSDGRIICSPFGRGVRLLALDHYCSELPGVVKTFDGPREMHEIGQSLGIHQDLVVCSKFNPRFSMLVSGCLEGKIVWYQPFSGESMSLPP